MILDLAAVASTGPVVDLSWTAPAGLDSQTVQRREFVATGGFEDRFAEIDTERWGVSDGAATIAAVNGQLVVTVPTSADDDWAYLRSVGTYDLSAEGSYFQARIVQRLASASSGGRPETWINVRLDGDNQITWETLAGTSSTQGLRALIRNAGTPTVDTYGSYNASNHVWWRIETNGDGDLMVRTAPMGSDGGPGTWTTHGTYTPSWSLEAVHVELGAGAWSVTLTQNVAILADAEVVTGDTAAWSTLDSVSAVAETYQDTSVSLNDEWEYRVLAVDGTEQLPSNVAYALVVPGLEPPDAATGLDATDGGQPVVMWTDNADDETAYYVHRTTSATVPTGAGTRTSPALDPDTEEWTDSDPPLSLVGTEVYYHVEAVGPGGSTFSASPASATIHPTLYRPHYSTFSSTHTHETELWLPEGRVALGILAPRAQSGKTLVGSLLQSESVVSTDSITMDLQRSSEDTAEEGVVLDVPSSGVYTVRVTHDSDTSLEFSALIVRVSDPASGTVVAAGQATGESGPAAVWYGGQFFRLYVEMYSHDRWLSVDGVPFGRVLTAPLAGRNDHWHVATIILASPGRGIAMLASGHHSTRVHCCYAPDVDGEIDLDQLSSQFEFGSTSRFTYGAACVSEREGVDEIYLVIRGRESGSSDVHRFNGLLMRIQDLFTGSPSVIYDTVGRATGSSANGRAWYPNNPYVVQVGGQERLVASWTVRTNELGGTLYPWLVVVVFHPEEGTDGRWYSITGTASSADRGTVSSPRFADEMWPQPVEDGGLELLGSTEGDSVEFRPRAVPLVDMSDWPNSAKVAGSVIVDATGVRRWFINDGSGPTLNDDWFDPSGDDGLRGYGPNERPYHIWWPRPGSHVAYLAMVAPGSERAWLVKIVNPWSHTDFRMHWIAASGTSEVTISDDVPSGGPLPTVFGYAPDDAGTIENPSASDMYPHLWGVRMIDAATAIVDVGVNDIQGNWVWVQGAHVVWDVSGANTPPPAPVLLTPADEAVVS